MENPKPTKVAEKSNGSGARIINHIPDLLNKKGLAARDLMYGARLAPGTAYAIADPDRKNKSIRFDVLAKICQYLEVDLTEILEYVPSK